MSYENKGRITDMGVTFHHYVSPFSFVMGVLWFSAFIFLGLLMRKLKFPIKFSVVPLLLLLVLSVLRMFLAVEIPGMKVVLSKTVYPVIVNLLRYEIISHRVFGLPINVANVLICVWIIGAVWLTARYVNEYIGRFGSLMRWLGSYERDEYAESLLSDIIGSDKNFRVFRNGCFSTAIATAFKPYIILPETDFSPDELRVILLHEWKHIQDKDYLIDIIINIICFVFWWNPVVYILRRNFRFATELKCDRFAVSDKKDFHHYLKGILLLRKLEKEKMNKHMEYEGTNALINDGDELADRLIVLAMQGESRKKRILTNVCYSIVILAFFIVSYMFTILPAFWESPDISMIAENFRGEYSESGEIFMAGENFFVNNGDGTFSLYIDGQFVGYADDTHEAINWLPIRERN